MDIEEMEKIADEMKDLLKKKNQMYGDGNIIKMGKLGALARVEEKIERLRNMIKNDIQDEESREDSWKDIAGFGIIGVMLERDKWLTEEEKQEQRTEKPEEDKEEKKAE